MNDEGPALGSGAAYFLRTHGKGRGPFSIEELQALAEDALVKPESEISPSLDGPWKPVSAHPLASRILGNRTRKETFSRENHAGQPTVSHNDLIAAANQARPFSAAPADPAATAPVKNDVHRILELNLQHDQARGSYRVAYPYTRRSRRRRDYWALLLGIGLLIFVVLIVEAYICVQVQVTVAKMPDQFQPIFRQVLFGSPLFFYGLAMFIFFWAALTWLMYGVMDDY